MQDIFINSFLHTDALSYIEKHLDRFPPIKLDRILDWTAIEQYPAGRKTRYLRDNGGRPAYPLLSIFKAVLHSQWHSLSDPELEYSPITRTAGGKQRQAIEVDKSGAICGKTAPSKDHDTRWIKKNGKFKLGYKQHTRTDSDGYLKKLHITPTNAHECNHFEPLPEGIASNTAVYGDKGYDSKANREHLQSKQLSKTRYVVEQSTLHRKFRYARASYFGLLKVAAQSHLKAICLNLLKTANRLSVPVAA